MCRFAAPIESDGYAVAFCVLRELSSIGLILWEGKKALHTCFTFGGRQGTDSPAGGQGIDFPTGGDTVRGEQDSRIYTLQKKIAKG